MALRWLSAIGAMTLLLHATAAGAQDKTAEAQARFSEGVKAYKRGDYESARAAFLQSVALIPRGSVLRNLGLAEMELGRPVDALHHLRAALALPDLDPERRRVTETDVRDAYAATGHIAIETREGATLTVDGDAVEGTAPFKEPVDVMPGRHTLEANLAAKTVRAEVEAKPGAVVGANLPIEPSTSPPVGTAAPLPRVAAVAPPLTVPPVQASPPLAKHQFWNARQELGAGAVALGLLSTVLGAYFYTQAVDAQNRANTARAGLARWSCSGLTRPQACATANDAWSTQSTDATLNYVFLGIGAAGVVAGAAMFLWPESSSSVAIGPVVTSNGGGVHFRGEF